MLEKELSDFLLLYGCKAALRASEEIMKIYSQENINVTLKSDSSLITEADTLSHNIIKEVLSTTRTPLLSEEGRNMLYEERCSWELYWLVDPLDGTHEFVQKNDEFIVSIALMHNNIPVIGVIAVPATGKLYFSLQNRGAYKLEATPKGYLDFENIDDFIAVSTQMKHIERDNKNIKLVITRSHINDEILFKVEDYKKEYESVKLITCGSGLKFCLLADGDADVYIRTTPLFDWDIAAGQAIMKELGYKMRHTNGEEIQYNKNELVIEPFMVTTL
ncbi:MAG: 3'(2'),5'-bisphosphate nucleotidase CysQ [Rikenellaceae bacterium]